jgi:DNA-binding transcriptional MerR regulator
VKQTKPDQSAFFLSTGDLARLTGIPQQTLITWDRSRVLKAKARPGRRTSSRAPRRYDEDGLTAALFAMNASQMGFKRDAFKVMIRLIQSGERKPLQRAAIFTYQTIPGMMEHIFTPDAEEENDRRWIDTLHDRGTLIGEPTSLWEIRGEFLKMARGLARLSKEGRLPLVPRGR